MIRTTQRRRRLRLASGLFLVGAALGSSPARAQEARRWEISGFAGGFFGTRTYTSEELKVSMANAPTFGLRLGYLVAPAFTLEAAWSRASSRLVPTNPETGAAAGVEEPVTVNSYEADVLYGFGGERLRGYLGVGAGAQSVAPAVETLSGSASTQAAANFAMGATYRLSPSLALRLDARYRWRGGASRVARIVCYPYGCTPFLTNIFSTAEITGGVTYRF